MDTSQQPAIIDGNVTLTHADLDVAISGTAAHLRHLGVSAGARVGVCLAPSWRYVVLLLSLIEARAIACPLNPALPSDAILVHLQQANSTMLISDAPLVPPQILHLDPAALIPDLAARSLHRSSLVLHPSHDQPATIVFTSGSTKQPKAVLHTLGNHVYNALGSNTNIPFEPGDRWLLALPLYHVSGLSIVFRMLVGGATVVLPDSRSDLATTITQHGITHVSLVSTQLVRLLQTLPGPPALRQLKAILLGGSTMPRAALSQAYDMGLPIHTSYGLSEMASQVTTTPPNVPHSKRFTAGCVLPHREVRIDHDGQIWVRGQTRFAGYVQGDTLQQPFDGDGWFATRDLGQVDADGYLSVQGRIDNMFISGGENIQPEEIEAALLQIDGIQQALVVPVPHPEFGFRPVAFVDAARIDQGTLVALLETQLPRFKLPVAFYAWPDLPGGGIKASRTQFAQLALTQLHTHPA